jgi:hypothetical protein
MHELFMLQIGISNQASAESKALWANHVKHLT